VVLCREEARAPEPGLSGGEHADHLPVQSLQRRRGGPHSSLLGRHKKPSLFKNMLFAILNSIVSRVNITAHVTISTCVVHVTRRYHASEKVRATYCFWYYTAFSIFYFSMLLFLMNRYSSQLLKFIALKLFAENHTNNAGARLSCKDYL
jgi:hypothetical protein